MNWNSSDCALQDRLICENGNEFFDTLVQYSRVDDAQLPMNGSHKLRFIYRGLGNADHRQVPTALRTEEEHKQMYDLLWEIYESYWGGSDKIDKNLESNQRRAEIAVISYFYRYAERAGLKLPDIGNDHVRNELLAGNGYVMDAAAIGGSPFKFEGLENEIGTWLLSCLLPVFGLAQHYGLPTRLLDWSYDPLVSCYFAASGALQRLDNNEDPNSCLSIWATVANSFELYGKYDSMGHRNTSSLGVLPARIVQPPFADNPNLNSQKGVFTVFRQQVLEADTPTDRREFHSAIDSYVNTSDKFPDSRMPAPSFKSLFLPIREAPRLFFRLHSFGFNASKVFHGYAGATRAVTDLAIMNKHLRK